MTWRDRERESVSVSDADNVLVMQLCNRDRESVSTDQVEQKITAFNLPVTCRDRESMSVSVIVSAADLMLIM